MKIIANSKKTMPAAAAALAMLPAISTDAFVMPGRKAAVASVTSSFSPTSLVASTLETPNVVVGDNELSKDSNSKPRTSLDVRIHGEWYDLTGR